MTMPGPGVTCSGSCAQCPTSADGLVARPVGYRPSLRLMAGAAAIFVVPLVAAVLGSWAGGAVAGLEAPGAVVGMAAAMAGVRAAVLRREPERIHR